MLQRLRPGCTFIGLLFVCPELSPWAPMRRASPRSSTGTSRHSATPGRRQKPAEDRRDRGVVGGAGNVNRQLDDLAEAGRAHGLTPEQLDAVRRAVGLGHKRKIALDRIPWAVSRDKAHGLAGAFAGHFGGFLRKEYREHFILGQHEAREWMTHWLPAHLTSLRIRDDADRLSIQAFLDEPLPSLPVLSPEPAWSSIPQPERPGIVTQGGNRLEVLAKRWVPGLGTFLPSMQKLMEPLARSSLCGGPPSPPNWIGALRALRGTAIGASMFKWGKGVFIALALMLVAADMIGAQAGRSYAWSAAIITAGILGAIVLATMWALDRSMRS